MAIRWKEWELKPSSTKTFNKTKAQKDAEDEAFAKKVYELSNQRQFSTLVRYYIDILFLN